MALQQRNYVYPEKNLIVSMSEPVLDDAEQKVVLESPQGMYHKDVSVRYSSFSLLRLLKFSITNDTTNM